jgi:Uma2 family endonuclease
MAVAIPPGNPLPLVRLSVAQYHAMRDASILTEDDRVELLEGMLVQKLTKKPPHRLATSLVRTALEAAIPPGHYVDSQEPITTADSEPEPDVVVVRGTPRNYANRHPGPGDVVLVVEVADDSVERDRLKAQLYATAGISVYWIVNLRSRVVEVHEEPRGGAYRKRTDYASGDVPVMLEGREVGQVAVEAILP